MNAVPVPAIADVCMILEGSYPYVSGGVSTWAHDLLLAQSDLRFHLVALVAANSSPELRYRLPGNVVGLSRIEVGKLPEGKRRMGGAAEFFPRIQQPLSRLLSGGSLEDIGELLRLLGPVRRGLGGGVLLNSPEAWRMLLRMYHDTHSHCAFLDYFWTWRAIVGGLYSVLLADLPPCRVYHAVSTGYAGLFAATAHLETGRPALLTEHGIYTNERRIEISMANWLHEAPSGAFTPDKTRRDLKDIWVDSFLSYSRACYQAAGSIITLYEGNQQFQVQDGADPVKLKVVPNGTDYERFAAIPRSASPRPPSVALIGRVVPIKDVKTFLRAIGLLRGLIPDVRAYVLGPTDETPAYFEECTALMAHLGLGDAVVFAGRVSLERYLGELDAIVLTSLSEAQPLVILEAGAAGVPVVATDVGACREMIHGRPGESPRLGQGGEVTPLANPGATAQALARLLTNPEYAARAGAAIRERVRVYYNKTAVDASYRELYDIWGRAGDRLAQGAA